MPGMAGINGCGRSWSVLFPSASWPMLQITQFIIMICLIVIYMIINSVPEEQIKALGADLTKPLKT